MGVKKTIIRPGSGRKPNHGEAVHAHYVGKLVSDGTEFDSSRARNKPLTFVIGIGSVIKGWDEGIMEMQEGEVATLEITSDFAYGESGAPGAIPPNADLQFEVELLAVGDYTPSSPGGCNVM
jgi:FKBP-type peptidyl-prolyl cis-trans isomerase